MKILALSGSLRAASNNSALLRAMARLSPHGVAIDVYQGLGELPLFNPDLEASDPFAVAQLRSHIIASDALLIASPEYAHGITGVMKNALDWMVSSEAFVHKPVAILNASSRAVHANAALHEVISVMSAQIVESASITVPILGAKLTEDEIVQHPQISLSLRHALAALCEAVTMHRAMADAT